MLDFHKHFHGTPGGGGSSRVLPVVAFGAVAVVALPLISAVVSALVWVVAGAVGVGLLGAGGVYVARAPRRRAEALVWQQVQQQVEAQRYAALPQSSGPVRAHAVRLPSSEVTR